MRPLARFLRGKTLPRRLQRFRPESQHGELDQMLGESQAVLRQFGAEERLLPQRGRIPFIRGVTQSQRRRHAENRAESATGSEKRRRGSSGHRNPRGAQHQQLRQIFRLVKGKATFLQACICHRYFSQIRSEGMKRIVNVYTHGKEADFVLYHSLLLCLLSLSYSPIF